MRPNIETFIGCDSSFEDADIVLFGAPFDSTTSFRPGARFGSAAIRHESFGLETYSPYQQRDLCDCSVFDSGDLELCFGNAESALADIENRALQILRGKKLPLLVGGEHLVTLGAVRAALQTYPNLHVIHFDAHADLREDYLGARLSHACVMRRVWELLEDGPANPQKTSAAGPQKTGTAGPLESNDEPLKTGTAGPLESSDRPQKSAAELRIHQFCIRSGDRAEFVFARQHTDLHLFSFDGLEALTAELAQKRTPVYLTIDLDCLDPSAFPGTGTPEAGGVSFLQLLAAIRLVSQTNVVAADVNELAPMLDASGVSTATACKVLRELLLALAPKRSEKARAEF